MAKPLAKAYSVKPFLDHGHVPIRPGYPDSRSTSFDVTYHSNRVPVLKNREEHWSKNTDEGGSFHYFGLLRTQIIHEQEYDLNL